MAAQRLCAVANGSTEDETVGIFVNGNLVSFQGVEETSGTDASNTAESTSTTVFLNAGDIVQVQFY